MSIVKGVLAISLIMLLGMVSSNSIWTKGRPLAYVQRFKPNVAIQNNSKRMQAARGGPLYNGDTLRTGKNGYALIQFMDKSLSRVKPNSVLVIKGKVQNKNNSSLRIGLKAGEIFLNITKRNRRSFQVATPTSIASVKGTRFGVRQREDYFWVEEGSIELVSNQTKQAELLTQKMYGKVTANGQIKVGQLSDTEINNLSEEYEELDKKVKPQKIQIRFKDDDGEIREIELKYFEN